MRAIMRLACMFLAAAFVIILTVQPRAIAQVQVFPYSYDWTTPAPSPLTATGGGDGNYRTSSQNPAPEWQVSPIGGTGAGDGGPCAIVGPFRGNGKESYLDLVLETSGRDFNRTEMYSFSVKRTSPSGPGTIRVQENSSGTFIDIPSSTRNLIELPTTHDIYLGGIFLPETVELKASVTLRIVVTALDANSYTPAVFVDNNSVSGGALPVQLASASAYLLRDNDVEVVWNTVSETNNYGFELYRKRGETGEWVKMGFMGGQGTTLAPHAYSYVDRSVAFGKYSYRIKQIDLDGASHSFPEMEVNVGVGSDKFVLAQNYPNPFNPSTIVEFTIPKSGFATLKVYNVLGQEVATLFEGNADAGKILISRFNASNLPSGLYFYTLRSSGKVETKRMLLLK